VDQPGTETLQAEKRSAPQKRLDSWKEIATWLNRDVTTAQRWEKREGMPVHRHAHEKRGSVYALTSELDSWLASRKLPAEEAFEEATVESSPAQARTEPAWNSRTGHRWILFAVVVFSLVAAFGWLGWRRFAASSPPQKIRSLAVLPLRNFSGDPSQEYLADGITEALIGRLAGIRDLHVISHTSVMRFRNSQLSVPEIARALHVDAVVEGSVIRDGNRIRVSAQLIRGSTDQHFWSETYDREFRDVLALESDLASSIAEKVEVTVTGEEHRRIAQGRPVAPEVYESYLKGLYALNTSNSPSDVERSIGYFNDATTKDSTFAPAFLGKAEAYNVLGTVFVGVPPAQTRPGVISSARRALVLDPDSADAHVLLADVLQEQWHWAEAADEYRHALELNPNDADAHAGFALWLVCQGRTDEAVAAIRAARALDPVGISGVSVAWILFLSHRFDEAARELQSILTAQPDSPRALWYLGFVLNARQQPQEAISPLEKAASLTNRNPAVLAILMRAYAHNGRRSDALRLLAEIQQRSRTGYVPAGAFVNAYLGLGDTEQAFVWLDRAAAEQSNIVQFLKVHPYFDPLRGDRRFAELERRVGLD
jgi:TolB-like protein/Tfp pilus assembly protein PilF